MGRPAVERAMKALYYGQTAVKAEVDSIYDAGKDMSTALKAKSFVNSIVDFMGFLDITKEQALEDYAMITDEKRCIARKIAFQAYVRGCCCVCTRCCYLAGCCTMTCAAGQHKLVYLPAGGPSLCPPPHLPPPPATQALSSPRCHQRFQHYARPFG